MDRSPKKIGVVLKTAASGMVDKLWSKNTKEAGTLSSQSSSPQKSS
jgi:hypothetical protein